MIEKLRKKTPPQTWYAWVMLWFIWGMNGTSREYLNKLSPYIIEEFNLSGTALGLLQTICQFALAIGSIPLIAWADKAGVGYKRTLRAMILGLAYLTATCLCGFGFAYTAFAVFAVLQILRGFFSGAGEAIEVGMMMEWCPREKSGFFSGLHHTGYPWLSFLTGLIITWALTATDGAAWKYTFFLIPFIGYIAWFAFKKFSTEKNYIKFQENTVKEELTVPILGNADEFKAPPGLIKRICKNPNIFIMIFVAFCCLFGWAGITYWMTPYISYVGGWDPAIAASLSVIFTITGGLGQIVWGHLADRFGAKITLQICCLWLVLAFWLMQFITNGIVWLVVCELFMGCCLSAVYAMIYKFVAVSSEPGGITTGNSLIVVGMYVGGGLATYIVGALIDFGGGWESSDGYILGLYVLCGVMFLGFILTTLFTRETNGPRMGKDFSLVSLKACNLEKEIEKSEDK